MADIFISYAREDIERVRPIVKELEKLGWSVFWDTKIQPGDNWPVEITEALKSSQCVLVFWSLTSVDFKIHHWIREEAEAGRKKGILVPLLLDVVDLPIGFSHLQAADLSGWKKNSSAPEFQKLINAVTSKISSSAPPVITPTPSPTPESDPVSKSAFALNPKPPQEKTQSYRTTNPKTERQLDVTGNENAPFKINTKLAVVAVAVVLAIIFLVVGLTSSKQVHIPAGPVPVAQLKPALPDSAVLRAKEKANDLLLRQAEEAILKAQNEAAAARQEAAKLQARQVADSLRQAKEAKLKAKQDAVASQKAATLKAENVAAAKPPPAITTLEIGDEYGGGKIAWIDATGKHGLIAAKADLPGGDKYSWDAAKKACQNLVQNGYSDWYLPSKDDLKRLHLAKNTLGGFVVYFYWSSTEDNAVNAWLQNFGDGTQSNVDKDGVWRVRPVRSF